MIVRAHRVRKVNNNVRDAYTIYLILVQQKECWFNERQSTADAIDYVADVPINLNSAISIVSDRTKRQLTTAQKLPINLLTLDVSLGDTGDSQINPWRQRTP